MEIVVQEGFDGLSMQKLALAAGVSAGTIYIYFKDRKELIEKISVKAIERMLTETMAGFHPELPFEEGMRIQWKNRTKYWLDNPLEARFTEQVRHSNISSQIYDNVKSEFSKIMKTFLKNAVLRNEIKPMDPEVFWAVAFAPLYQLIKYHLDGKGLKRQEFTLSDKMLEDALKLVLNAFKTTN